MDTSPQPSSPIRPTLRKQLIAAREALSDAERDQRSRQLSAHLAVVLESLAPKCLGFYWPHRAEPDITTQIKEWLAAGTQRTAALPVVETVGTALRFRHWTPRTPLVADRHGIPVPAQGAWLIPDVILIPVNGFDRHGHRIGYGGGYFDRTLASMTPKPTSIGIGFELARVEDTQPAPHDMALDWVITEAGVAVRPPGAS